MMMILGSTKCSIFLVSDQDTFCVQNNAGTAISVVYYCYLPSPFEVTIHSPFQSCISFYTAEVIKLLANICVFKIFVSLLKPEKFGAFIIKKNAVEHKRGKFQGTCNASRTTYDCFCKCGIEGIGV